MERQITFNYKTTLPKEANAPSVHIQEPGKNLQYLVSFYSIKNNEKKLICKGYCKSNQTIVSGFRQWFENWFITVEDDNGVIAEDLFNPIGKTIFLKIDAYALGDNIAWIPYIEEFRKKHNCVIICSTFYNDLFKKLYPNILFVKPNTNIDNVYAQYYIGAQNDYNTKYSNTISDEHPLQATAYNNLGLEPVEIRPCLEKILLNRNYEKKYVCISEYASHENKRWKRPNGWQELVNFIHNKGYDVVVISKEPTNLENVINLTGNYDILHRAQTLLDAEFFIGVSSGLSWLSWAVGTHVVMISDVTPISHEFQTNITRISANPNLTKVDYEAENVTSITDAIKAISNLIN